MKPPAARTEDRPKKSGECPCGSGRAYGVCCGKARTRASSPQGALELVLTLASGRRIWKKADLRAHLRLSRWGMDSVIAWALAQHPPLVKKVPQTDGWPLYQGDAQAISAFVARYQREAEATA